MATMFGWNKNMETVSPLNPSAVASGNQKPKIYGLAKLSAIDPVTCVEQHARFVDWYTAAFGAGGALLGLTNTRWDVATMAAVIGAMGRNYLTQETECQSVFNALFDVVFALAGYETVLWLKGRM